MSRSATGAARASLAALVALASTALLAGGLSAQSLAPAPSLPRCAQPGPTCPTPTPDSGIVWPSMEFEGGDASQLAFTSTCGIWGTSPITLTGEGAAGSAVHTVTFDHYEPESSQWFGRVTGTYTGPNGLTTPVDEGALIYYAFDLGQWVLVAGWAAQIPARACVLSSPSPGV
jgi:hypothetical protein